MRLSHENRATYVKHPILVALLEGVTPTRPGGGLARAVDERRHQVEKNKEGRIAKPIFPSIIPMDSGKSQKRLPGKPIHQLQGDTWLQYEQRKSAANARRASNISVHQGPPPPPLHPPQPPNLIFPRAYMMLQPNIIDNYAPSQRYSPNPNTLQKRAALADFVDLVNSYDPQYATESDALASVLPIQLPVRTQERSSQPPPQSPPSNPYSNPTITPQLDTGSFSQLKKNDEYEVLAIGSVINSIISGDLRPFYDWLHKKLPVSSDRSQIRGERIPEIVNRLKARQNIVLEKNKALVVALKVHHSLSGN